jgi:uncharacterized YigZ family protein
LREIKNQDEYLTIKDFRREKLLVKGSKFIATAIPISSEKEAKLSLEKIKKEFHDATHNPYAYIIAEGGIQKFSDDREPSGTAGKKIFFAIESRNLKDILVVVTRYFGGVKLGTGGLSKAYYESALKTLKDCNFIIKEQRAGLHILFPRERYDQVQKVLNREKVKVMKLAFGDRVRMEIDFSQAIYSRLMEKLKSSTRGEIEFEKT